MIDTQQSTPSVLPSVERIQQELARAKSIDDFFGKEGIFARLFADTLEQMLEAELTAHLGYPRHAPEGRNSGNSRNGKRPRTLRTSTGDTTIQMPRDRQATLHEPYGVEVSPATISTVTDKVWSLVEGWQNRALAAVYPIVYLDAIHL